MKRKTVSPATVISIIALIFAVAGTAIASVATVSVLSKKEKKQTRRVADAEIKKLGPGLSVKSAATAGDASQLGGAPPSRYLDACPAGMTLVGSARDLCVDSADRATSQDWSGSAGVCRQAGLRLPNIGEVLEAGNTIVASVGGSHFYWTTNIWDDAGTSPPEQGWGFFTDAGGGIHTYNRTNQFSVRCVATPSTG